MQTEIPFLFLRGGTSRGLYFKAEHLPGDQATLHRVLRTALGSGHPLNIDGLGGGATVTTKVAILSRGAEVIDFYFAQVDPLREEVDTRPSCFNILSGVGPAALELGLWPAQDGETQVPIHAVNTGARVDARVQTPGGQVSYDGAQAIDGVPGTAAPIALGFRDIAGASCGAMLPTGQPRDQIGGIDVTLLDVAMPLMILRAADLGLSGGETAAEIDADTALLARIEALRCEAGRRMMAGADVSRSVTPKVALISAPVAGGALRARYLTPWACHPSMAVSGGQCLAACAVLPGSVADGLSVTPVTGPAELCIEHPMGLLPVHLDFMRDRGQVAIKGAGLVRTARLLARGMVMVPRTVWAGV